MRIEDVVKLSVPEDVAKQIVAMNEAEIAAEAKKLTDKEAELTMAADKIKELSETVKRFDGVDPEKLKTEMAALQKKYDEDTVALKLDNALALALADSGAIDKDIVKSQLDRSIIKFGDDGKLVGVSEQLEKLKADKAFLFGAEKSAEQSTGMTAQLGTQHGDPAGNSGGDTLASALKDHYKV